MLAAESVEADRKRLDAITALIPPRNFRLAFSVRVVCKHRVARRRPLPRCCCGGCLVNQGCCKTPVTSQRWEGSTCNMQRTRCCASLDTSCKGTSGGVRVGVQRLPVRLRPHLPLGIIEGVLPLPDLPVLISHILRVPKGQVATT